MVTLHYTHFTYSVDGYDIEGDQLEEEYDYQLGVFGYEDDQFCEIDAYEEREAQRVRLEEFAFHSSRAI